MISLRDYTAHDGLGLAELVARKEVTPDELAAAAFEAVAKVNPRINAVLHTIPKEAATEIRAGLPRGPFTGVPFLIKEIVLHAKGVRCEMGSKLAQGYVPDADTELMARFRRAGLVLAGTTQTPEFGYNPTTETRAFGPVHNPWDLGRSPGGSSGGSGAAVAAGVVPIAHANDGGGSIRIPASCNGLVGLKPSRDRIPSGPDYGDLLCGLACEFALTRSVRDAAALLDAVAGPDPGAPGHPVPPARPYRELIGTPPGRLRIAWTATPASGAKIDPECEKAVHETVRLLEGLGHTLIRGSPALRLGLVPRKRECHLGRFRRRLDRFRGGDDRAQAGAGQSRSRHPRLLRRRQALLRDRSAQRDDALQRGVAPGRRFLRESGRARHTDDRAPARAIR